VDHHRRTSHHEDLQVSRFSLSSQIRKSCWGAAFAKIRARALGTKLAEYLIGGDFCPRRAMKTSYRTLWIWRMQTALWPHDGVSTGEARRT
jgi:hypothetical protein